MRKILTMSLLGTASLLAGCAPMRALDVASGYVSRTICQETFISGLSPERSYRDNIWATPGLGLLDGALRYQVNEATREVRTTIAGGFASRAVYREGLGYLLVHEKTPGQALLAKAPAHEESAAPALPEIAGRETVTSSDPQMQAALERAFAEPEH